MNFSPPCKPSLILIISQPLPYTHQQVRTRPGITLCSTLSQQTARFHLSLLFFFFFFDFCSWCLFPSGTSVPSSCCMFMCCLIHAPAGLEVAYSACPSLIQDLDVTHTKELQERAALCPSEPFCPPLLPPNLSSATDHCGVH